ncbi:MAG TPA: prepilin-type N-terminal cleavage/methylation domain-containing protein [Fimbriimonas sp.]
MRRGFTLIELLVVIAITAILAAILFPVFAQAKDAAKATGCLGNLKQMGTGLTLYVNDHDDTYPITFYGAAGESGFCIMSSFQAVQPYQKSAQLVVCPSDPRPLDYAAGSQLLGYPAPCSSSPNVTKMSYQPNFSLIDVGDPNFLVNPYTGQTGRPVTQGSEVGFPADTAAFAEATIALTGGSANFVTYQMPVQPRHRSRLTTVWADGHAGTLSVKADSASDGRQLGGLALDRTPILAWKITSQGPYAGRREIEGIPYQDESGGWSLR